MSLTSLAADDCPFVEAGPLAAYNRLVETLEETATELPELSADAPMKDLVARLERIAEVMRRKKYRIGFIGVSTAGKSTTICNLLGVRETESPTPTGSGGATTSCITRLFRERPDKAPSVRLNYMSEEEFAKRRDNICQRLQLDHGRTNAEILSDIGARLGGNGDVPEAAVWRYLQRLLSSYNAFRGLLGASELGDYAERKAYVMHTGQPSKYALLGEAVIGLDNDSLPDNLEFIDLPGLGTSNKTDDLLTQQFLEELDGAFIFQTAQQQGSAAGSDLLDDLRKQFGDLRDRVWAVATRFDKLDPNGIHGDLQGKTAFSHVEEYLANQGLDIEQVLMLGNGFYQSLIPYGGVLERVPTAERHDILVRCNFILGPDDMPTVPEKFRQGDPRLLSAYKEVLRDGGIGRLRATITERVHGAVQRKVNRDVERELRQIGGRLDALIEAARMRATLDEDAIVAALQWTNALRELIDRLNSDAAQEVFEKPAAEIKKTLIEHLGRAIPRDQVKPANHRVCAKLLQVQAKRASDQHTEAIYNAVALLFDQTGLPAIKLRCSGDRTTLHPRDEFWTPFCNDRVVHETTNYFLAFDRFCEGYPAPPSGDGEAKYVLNAGDYQRIMEQKIALAVNECIARIALAIYQCLDTARQKYELLGLE